LFAQNKKDTKDQEGSNKVQFSSIQFFTLNLKNSDNAKSRGGATKDEKKVFV